MIRTRPNLAIATIMMMIAASPIFAVGTVTQSLNTLGAQNWVLAINWTGDATTGTVPATAMLSAQIIQGYRVFAVETAPGSPAPTNLYNVTLTTFLGVDVLGGGGASLSNTTAAALQVPATAPPVNGALTFNLSGNSVAGAKGNVLVYFAPISQVTGLLAPTGPSLTGNNLFSGNASFSGTSTFSGPVNSSNTNTFSGSNTFSNAAILSGTNTLSGVTTAKNINRTRMVDFTNTAGWAGADGCAWINSAVTDLAGNGGTIDARGLASGNTTCTSGTISIPSNVTLLLSGNITTNANPGLLVTGSTPTGAIQGSGRANAVFTCSANNVKCIDIGGSEVALRNFSVSDLKIATTGTTGTTLAIEDFAISISFQRLYLTPTGTCIQFVPGTQGFIFEDFQDIRCDGYTGVGFSANLVGNATGTNLQLTNVYMNAAGSTTGTIGFDIEKWNAVTINSSDSDANTNSTGTPTGLKLAGVAGVTGGLTINSFHCEFTSTTCISIVGPGSYVFSAPSGINNAELIDVNAVSSVVILDPWSNGTTGANDIILEAASGGGQYFISNPFYLSKPFTASTGAEYTLLGAQGNTPLLTLVGDEFANNHGLGLFNQHTGGHNWNIGEQFALGRLSFRDVTVGGTGAFSLTAPTSGSFEAILSGTAITATRTYTFPDTTGNLAVLQAGDSLFGTYRVTTDQTITAGASLTNIPGLSWTFPANTALNVKFTCDLLYSQATAAASDSFGFQDVTVAPTNAESYARADTSATAFTAGNTAAAGVTTAVTVVTYTPSAATTVFGAHIDGLIEQPSNASTSVFNIMAQFTTNNGTIKRGSSCQVF